MEHAVVVYPDRRVIPVREDGVQVGADRQGRAVAALEPTQDVADLVLADLVQPQLLQPAGEVGRPVGLAKGRGGDLVDLDLFGDPAIVVLFQKIQGRFNRRISDQFGQGSAHGRVDEVGFVVRHACILTSSDSQKYVPRILFREPL